MLGACCLSVQGETSEAGLRQSLGHDAIPVVFDEAEGEDKRNQDRMQAVMALMRAASAEDGGVMAKGTSSGTAKTYRIRSCFAFASIAVQVHQQSDRTRVTVLTLSRPNTTKQQWEDKRRYFTKTFTPDYVQRLQARTVALLPTILANTKTFARVIAEELGEQRLGDQLAPMFAGRVSLITSELLTEHEARELFQGYEFDDERSLMDTKDEIACLKYLMEQQVIVHNRDDRTMNVAVSELIQAVDNVEGGIFVTSSIASEVLSRCGIRVELDHIYISNTALWVKSALKDTQWAKNHSRILIRIPGAIASPSMRFAGGLVSRAIQIPLNVLYLQ
jgi:putative DNA primase/helicase